MNMIKFFKKIGLVLGLLFFLFILLFYYFEGMSFGVNVVLVSIFWIVIWWIIEVILMVVILLLFIILFLLIGVLELQDIMVVFGYKYIFLYIGGFILVIVIECWNLYCWLVLNIICWIGINVCSIILGFMVVIVFLLMWIFNMVFFVMMLFIGMVIIKQLKDYLVIQENENCVFGQVFMLGIVYSVFIGGIVMFIGILLNLVLVIIIQELYGIEIIFLCWVIFGLFISIVLLFICWCYLVFYICFFQQQFFLGGKVEIQW